VADVSLRKVERNIVKGIGIIAAILVTITVIGFLIASLNAYKTGDVGSFVEWFANWFADNLVFGVYIFIIAIIIGLISPRIARALRKMGGV